MRRQLAFGLVAVLLTACGPKPPPPDLSALGGLKDKWRSYTCQLTYTSAHGPIVSRSRAVMTLKLDDAAPSPHWTTDSLLVTEPLADAAGFDPFLIFRPGIQRTAASRDGTRIVLDELNGVPIVFNAAGGVLEWKSEGGLGPSSYEGACG